MAINRNEMAANYGWSLAVLESDPELARLFKRAVGPPAYSQARFVAELRDTNWYKRHSASQRQMLVLQKADPAEYNRRRAQMRAQMQQQYYQLTGHKTTERGGPGITLWRFADQALMYGYNEAEITDLVGRMVQAQHLMVNGSLGGSLGDAERQLRQASEDYGLPFSETAFARQLNSIATQQADLTSVIAQYRKLAESKYAGFADEIKRGATVKDIAEPYKQLMAKTLEVSDRSIGTDDSFIQKALTFRPTTNGKVGPPTGMPMWEFEQQLKNDPRWLKTQNAQDAIMAVGNKVLQDMGVVSGGGNG